MDEIRRERHGDLCRRLDDVLAESTETRKVIEDTVRRKREAQARARAFEAEIREQLRRRAEGDEDDSDARDLGPLSKVG
jgi:hypothetical protein